MTNINGEKLTKRVVALLKRLYSPLNRKQLKKAARTHQKYYHRLIQSLESLSLRITGQTPLNQLYTVASDGLIHNLWELPNLVLIEQTYRWDEAVQQALEKQQDQQEKGEKTRDENLYWFLYWTDSPVVRLERLDSLTRNLSHCLVVNHESKTARPCIDCDEMLQTMICMNTRLRSELSTVIKARRDTIRHALQCARRLSQKLTVVKHEKRIKNEQEEDGNDRPHKRIKRFDQEVKLELKPLDPFQWSQFMARRAWLQQMTEGMDQEADQADHADPS